MDPSFPIYGSILKIKDEKSKFENTLFFVQYISPKKLFSFLIKVLKWLN